MPWKETSPVDQRERFALACIDKEDTMVALCRRFGISRKTGYKWLGRYLVGLEVEDRSSRPKTSPTAVTPAMEAFIVEARKRCPRWGPRKLRAALMRTNPKAEFPSSSTFAAIFKRNGLVTPRRRRRRMQPANDPLAHAQGPNTLWCIDFKGDFETGKTRCYPLTITDAYSRYLIACIALRNTRATTVRRAMRAVFEEFGLPEAIRSDNGSPFAAASSLHGMTELSLWWMRLGIRHERIAPGKPQQNGRHERMHLTLKQATVSPPERSHKAQQRSFDRFRAEYNYERPHEALNNEVPADFYELSRVPLPDPYFGADFEYPDFEYELFKADDRGGIYWTNRQRLQICAAFARERLAAQWDGGHWNILFHGKLFLGRVIRSGDRLAFLRADSRQLRGLRQSEQLNATPGAQPESIEEGRTCAERRLIDGRCATENVPKSRALRAHASSSDAKTQRA